MTRKKNGKGKGKDTAVEPPKTHNVKALNDIRRECATEMRRIQRERADLNEDATGIRERLRDNGIDVKGFMAALRLADMDDVPARDTYLDELRMSMAALGMGEQGDFFQAAKQTIGEGDDPRPSFLKDKHEEAEQGETVN